MLALACLLFALLGRGNKDVSVPDGNVTQEQESAFPAETAATETVIPMPWDESGAKQPADYTWEEYDALTGAQQKAFKAYLGVEVYGKWLDGVRETADVKPWDEIGAKQPEEYSWEEYEALPTVHQIAFQHYLGLDAFTLWLNNVQGQLVATPWDEPGAKQPADYTWEEFEALTGSQQMIFQYSLGTAGFQHWLEEAQRQEEVFPWETEGAKQPADYTLKEFEILTPAQQMAFQAVLGFDAFDAWLNHSQVQNVTYPWEKAGAKQPAAYTWKEFESLTPEQQMAFQDTLGAEEFDEWMNRVQNQNVTNPWEKAGAKQPEEYTWEAFEVLTPAQQMAFQDALGADGFEIWMNQAQIQEEVNPWDKSGAKKPEDYTWEEFEALNPAQKMAFQNDLGPEAFDTWLAKNEN